MFTQEMQMAVVMWCEGAEGCTRETCGLWEKVFFGFLLVIDSQPAPINEKNKIKIQCWSISTQTTQLQLQSGNQAAAHLSTLAEPLLILIT